MAVPHDVFPGDDHCEICGVGLGDEVIIQEFADGGFARLCSECAAGATFSGEGEVARGPFVEDGAVSSESSLPFRDGLSLDDKLPFENAAERDPLEVTRELLHPVADLIALQGEMQSALERLAGSLERFAAELITDSVDKTTTVESRLKTLENELEKTRSRLREAESLLVLAGVTPPDGEAETRSAAPPEAERGQWVDEGLRSAVSPAVPPPSAGELKEESPAVEVTETAGEVTETASEATEMAAGAGGTTPAVAEPAAVPDADIWPTEVWEPPSAPEEISASSTFEAAAGTEAAFPGDRVEASAPDEETRESRAPESAPAPESAAASAPAPAPVTPEAPTPAPEAPEGQIDLAHTWPGTATGPPETLSGETLGRTASAGATRPSGEVFSLEEVQTAQRYFNDSPFTVRMRDVRRSLGRPQANLSRVVGPEPRVLVTIYWDIVWYQYLVDLSKGPVPGGERVSLFREGMELEELNECFRKKNASMDDDGRLDASELEVQLLSDPTVLITEMAPEEEKALEDATDEIWDQRISPEFKWDD